MKTLSSVNFKHFGFVTVKRWNRILASFALGLTIFVSCSVLAVAKQGKQVDVLELFTSQGCSSCPPADALLKTLSNKDDIIALTLPVNYWDHLGWKDTLAKETFTERQYAYAKARGDREIYTPQMIVNGVSHVVGSQRHAVESAMENTSRMLNQARVPISLERKGGSISLTTGAAPEGSGYDSGRIWVACYSKSVDVAIAHGENTGREIVYTNVVRELIPAGRWSGEPKQMTVDMPVAVPFDGIAVILQAEDSRAILGAAAIPFHP